MEMVKGKPFFCDVEKKIKQHPYLSKNAQCDVLIIGGGVMGAIASFFVGKQYDTILVEKSRLGYGCSSCSTALLEYNLDDDAKTLCGVMSRQQLVSVLKMGQLGLAKIDSFIKKQGNKCNYSKRDVLVYSTKASDANRIEREFVFLDKNGFACKLLDEKNSPFNFELARGILLENSGAEVNTYMLAKQLFEDSSAQIFENTCIESYQKCSEGYIAKTNFGAEIKCRHIIFATGFNFELFSNKSLCDSALTFSIVTNQIGKDFGWHNDALVQDLRTPYHYMRRLPDGRILLGGEDKAFEFGQCISQNMVEKKYDALFETLLEIFPQLKGKISIEYSFCGAFGSTQNNLGFIGKAKDGTHLFLSMGANGIVNAFYAIDLILDSLNGKIACDMAELFDPNRIKWDNINEKNNN